MTCNENEACALLPTSPSISSPALVTLSSRLLTPLIISFTSSFYPSSNLPLFYLVYLRPYTLPTPPPSFSIILVYWSQQIKHTHPPHHKYQPSSSNQPNCSRTQCRRGTFFFCAGKHYLMASNQPLRACCCLIIKKLVSFFSLPFAHSL